MINVRCDLLTTPTARCPSESLHTYTITLVKKILLSGAAESLVLVIRPQTLILLTLTALRSRRSSATSLSDLAYH